MTSRNLFKILLLLEKGKLLPLCLVLPFSNTLPRKAFFVMQTADSKSDVLMAQWQTGAQAQEEEAGFGLSRAQIPPLLAMSAFPISKRAGQE